MLSPRPPGQFCFVFTDLFYFVNIDYLETDESLDLADARTLSFSSSPLQR